MPELAHVLFPQPVAPKHVKLAKRTPEWLQRERASWLAEQKQRLHCWLSLAACQQKPWKAVADAVVRRGDPQDWQVAPSMSGAACVGQSYVTRMHSGRLQRHGSYGLHVARVLLVLVDLV